MCTSLVYRASNFVYKNCKVLEISQFQLKVCKISHKFVHLSCEIPVVTFNHGVLTHFLFSFQNQENDMLKQILQKYVDQPVKMVVYNSKSRTTRG